MEGYHETRAARPHAPEEARGDLGRLLRGPRGLLAPEFAILGREGEEIGRLEIDGAEGAELKAGHLEARIELSVLSGYTMLADGAEILAAEPLGVWNAPEIKCLDRLYQGRLSLLRNAARLHPLGKSDGAPHKRPYQP